METHYCGGCRQNKPESEFSFHRVKGKLRRRFRCRPCFNAYTERRRERAGRAFTPSQRRYRAKLSKMRAEGTNVERWIYQDARQSDQRNGRQFDLTREGIAELIRLGCSYCGEKNLRMTLDRIDNSIGHVQSNVVAACIRCNYARRNMPHAAWLCLLPGLRKARRLNLFGDWTGRVR
jgi:hypothetical protein